MSEDLESLGERIAEQAAHLDAALHRLLVSFHHRYVHEYGCSIEVHDDGPHVLDRRGRRILDAPPPSRPPDLGWETLLARNAELQITAATNEPLWDGARIDNGAVIDALLGVDRTAAIGGWS